MTRRRGASDTRPRGACGTYATLVERWQPRPVTMVELVDEGGYVLDLFQPFGGPTQAVRKVAADLRRRAELGALPPGTYIARCAGRRSIKEVVTVEAAPSPRELRP